MQSRNERHNTHKKTKAVSRQEHRKKAKKEKTNGSKRTLMAILGVVILLLLAIVSKVYFDVKGTADDLFKEANTNSKYSRDIDLSQPSGEKATEPFSVLLMGIDTGDLGRNDGMEDGRSDTMMIITVNPNTDRTTITSLQRDTYIMINGVYDKLNAAYAYDGPALAMETIENYLEIPIDYYISVNMRAFQEIVNAIGGVDVQSDLTFSEQGFDFVKGEKYHLEGERLLAYTRNRYDDPDGDYGRQNRQRQIITAVIDKMKSVETLASYQNLLASLGDNVQTNLRFNQMQDILMGYRSAAETIDEKALRGSGEMINGVSYQIVAEEDRLAMSEMLKRELEIDDTDEATDSSTDEVTDQDADQDVNTNTDESTNEGTDEDTTDFEY
ncbi:LCP family protein [Bavariicoccus seileri]|nr:LCP family protein [Bavariicoccus seileri]